MDNVFEFELGNSDLPVGEREIGFGLRDNELVEINSTSSYLESDSSNKHLLIHSPLSNDAAFERRFSQSTELNSSRQFAQSLNSSLSNADSYLTEWGFDEGVGTGPLPDIGGGSTGGGAGNFNPNGATNTIVNLDQVVFLDFDTGTDGNINYTPEIRDAVQVQIGIVYENFGVTFVQEAPTEGDFTTLVFNMGNSGGRAEDIDFRNLNKNDNAVINIQGFGLINTTEQIISASANIGAHELGHILGLRHHDAFGPIGAGIPAGIFFPGFDPAFPGPIDANETRFHIMNTPALAGDTVDVLSRSWLGEREAIKLTFAALGSTVVESTTPNDSFGQAQEIELSEIIVPNTIITGENEDAGDFSVDAVSVVGSFSFVDSRDFYSFQGEVGRVYSFEVISAVTNRYSNVDSIDSVISIFDSNFEFVDYYGTQATNDDDVEFAADAHLFDLFLPENGTYYARVQSFFEGDSGNYELFIQSFIASPFTLPDGDDHSDSLAFDQATVLQFEPVSNNVIARINGAIGFIDNPGERDVFSFTIDSTAKIIVDVRASTDFYDSFVELYDSNNEQIAFNDDNSNPGLENIADSQFIVRNLVAGDYFVVVSGSNSSTGQYRLGVRHNGASGIPDDPGDSFFAAANLNLRQLPATTFVNAGIELGNDNDFFNFTSLASGQLVVRSLALSGDLNTVLRGYDNDRELIDANNNFNGSLDSKISLDVIAGESYFVRLSSVGDSTGNYRLSLRTIPNLTSGGGGSTGGGPTSLTFGPGSDGFTYDKNVNLNLDGIHNYDGQLASSDLNLGRIDDYGVNDLGMLTA